MKAGFSKIVNTFSFAAVFWLTNDGHGAGVGRYGGRIGRFKPGSQCGPVSYDYVKGSFDLVATVIGDRLSIGIVPYPPREFPLLDVFNTQFSAPEFGSKILDVALEGGLFRWGGGGMFFAPECDGILPGSEGAFGVVKSSTVKNYDE